MNCCQLQFIFRKTPPSYTIIFNSEQTLVFCRPQRPYDGELRLSLVLALLSLQYWVCQATRSLKSASLGYFFFFMWPAQRPFTLFGEWKPSLATPPQRGAAWHCCGMAA